MRHLFSWAMVALCAIFAAFGAGVGFLFHHMLAGAIIGAILPLGVTAIFTLMGIVFFHLATKLFESARERPRSWF